MLFVFLARIPLHAACGGTTGEERSRLGGASPSGRSCIPQLDVQCSTVCMVSAHLSAFQGLSKAWTQVAASEVMLAAWPRVPVKQSQDAFVAVFRLLTRA